MRKKSIISIEQISVIVVSVAYFFNHPICLAQITPDSTLPNNSQVEIKNKLNLIEGGTTAGDNLFHSFQEFSIPTGFEAFFNNAANIKNIFSRITGEDISNIDGLIRSNGNANLFFLNPNGIIFGENASLDIGGSFLASTANKIEFADGTEFYTKDSSSPVTLTISVPIGLGFNAQSGSILVEGLGNNFTANEPIFSPLIQSGNFNGLAVKPGQSLTLLGNNIALQGGNLFAPNGKIQLGSISQGIVGFNIVDSSLDLQNVQDFSNISLTEKSSTDASGLTGGLINIQGKNISVQDGSVILVQSQASNSSSNIFLKASDLIEISGTSQNGLVRSYILSEAFAGNTANINIFAHDLKVERGAAIGIRAFNIADSKTLSLNITNSIQVSGFNQIIPLASSGISIVNLGNGDGGKLDIFTKDLVIDNAGNIGTITIGGQGDSGSLEVKAENITISGTNPLNDLPSNLFSSTIGDGEGGQIILTTSVLNILEGGQISTGSGANGNAGDILITANQVNLISDPDIRPVVGDVRTSRIIAIAAQPTAAQQAIVGNSLSVQGASGEIVINAGNIDIERARITVSNQGEGAIGNIKIKADSITNKLGIISASGLSELDSSDTTGGNIDIETNNLNLDTGTITAFTSFFGTGGNININADLIELNNNSLISASSGFRANSQETAKGNGGNITINTDIFTALNSSNVTANAVRGNGGNITINTDGYFVSDDFTISATSELGIDGTVTINTLNSDIEKDLKQSEPNISDLSELIAKTCLSPQRSRSSLTRGSTRGLPFNPDSEYRNLDFTLTGVGSLPQIPDDESRNPEQNLDTPEEEPIIPATQMIRTEDGEIYLIASLQEARDLICPKDNQ